MKLILRGGWIDTMAWQLVASPFTTGRITDSKKAHHASPLGKGLKVIPKPKNNPYDGLSYHHNPDDKT